MKTFKELLDEIAPVKVRMDKSADAKAKRRQARLDYKKNRTQIALASKNKRTQNEWQLKVKPLVEIGFKRE